MATCWQSWCSMQEEKDGKELDESQFACLKIEEERTEKQPHPVAET